MFEELANTNNFLVYAILIGPGVFYYIFKRLFVATEVFLKNLPSVISICCFFVIVLNKILHNVLVRSILNHTTYSILFFFIYIVFLPYIIALVIFYSNAILKLVLQVLSKITCIHTSSLENIISFFVPIRNPQPTPFDFIFSQPKNRYMIIEMENGGKFGAEFNAKSYASEYPYMQQIYLEKTYKLKDDMLLDEENDYGILIDMKKVVSIKIFDDDSKVFISQK